jgi:hypothetical protein
MVVIDGNVHCMQAGTRRSLHSQVSHGGKDSAHLGRFFAWKVAKRHNLSTLETKQVHISVSSYVYLMNIC